MPSYEETGLYIAAFDDPGIVSQDQKLLRNRLVVTLDRLRENAEILAADVARWVPQLTDHSVKHLDALWGTASCIAGPGYTLNPVEALVLGGAMLLHDLGNAVSAYPNRLDDLHGPEWDDLVIAVLTRRLGQRPTSSDLKSLSPEVSNEVLLRRLREVHSVACIRLATDGIATCNGTYHPLIEDVSIRDQLGWIIGNIAASHHWPLQRVESELNQYLAITEGPNSWKVDTMKIACLLRCADACQIDRRRAHPLQYAVHRPTGSSGAHWLAQQKLGVPVLPSGAELIEFRSNRPFASKDRVAWQIAYELAAKYADVELRKTDALLLKHRRSRFAAKGVAGAERPEEFARYVTTEGWRPVDISVRVTDVAGIVDKFGGRKLYGDNHLAPIRELMANAADAIRARRQRNDGGLQQDEGQILVRVYSRDNRYFLEIEDNGIGMSEEVLRGPLLDFGSSFWGSDLAMREFPGLLASGFRPTGQFGIGFFSVFMLANSVTVASRKYDEAQKSTSVLELEKGSLTPFLRDAILPAEAISMGGTKVTLTLVDDFSKTFKIPTTKASGRQTSALANLIASVAPTLDVDVTVQFENELPKPAIKANDWRRIPFAKLIGRLGNRPVTPPIANVVLKPTANGEQIGAGRLCAGNGAECAITVGGFLAERKKGCFDGVLLGHTDSLARHEGRPIMTPSEMGRLLEMHQRGPWNTSKEPAVILGSLMRKIGVLAEDLPVFMNEEKHSLSYKEVVDWAGAMAVGTEVLLDFQGTFDHEDGLGDITTLKIFEGYVDVQLKPNVLLAPSLEDASLFSESKFVPTRGKSTAPIDMLHLVKQAFSEAWKCETSDLPICWSERVIGTYELRHTYEDVEILAEVAVLTRPSDQPLFDSLTRTP